MAEHPVQGLMGSTVEKIREMADANTIIGTPITLDGSTTIIPVSKVTMGFASGGSDVGAKSTKEMFGGGSGAGVSITPIAFRSWWTSWPLLSRRTAPIRKKRKKRHSDLAAQYTE